VLLQFAKDLILKRNIMKIKIIVFIMLSVVQAQTKVWFDTDIMIGMPDKTQGK
jgi:hypothetical protein